MTQGEKWAIVSLFAAVVLFIYMVLAIGIDEDPKPSRTEPPAIPASIR
jgi:hypothetical protein